MSVIDDLTNVFVVVNQDPEQQPPQPLSPVVQLSGKAVAVPNYKGEPPPQFRGPTHMPAPTPVPQDVIVQATLKFEGNGGGWSESMHRAYASSEGFNPYFAMETLLSRYLPIRRACLSTTNVCAQCRISVVGVQGDSERKVQNSIGLGPGLRAGPPATLDQGLQVAFHDVSRQIHSYPSYGGWSTTDTGQETSSSRDRPNLTPVGQTFYDSLKGFYLQDPNGEYRDDGVPVIGSYDRDVAPIDIEQWSVDADGFLQVLLAVDPAVSRGEKVILHIPKNPYVRGGGGEKWVVSSVVGDEGWLVTLRAHACGPIAMYKGVFGTLTRETVSWYQIGFQDAGIWVRRANGAPFSQRRGRRSNKC